MLQLENVVGVVEGLGDAEAHWVDGRGTADSTIRRIVSTIEQH